MEEELVEFEACKECIKNSYKIMNGKLCRKPSINCPTIPNYIPDEQVIGYIKAKIKEKQHE